MCVYISYMLQKCTPYKCALYCAYIYIYIYVPNCVLCSFLCICEIVCSFFRSGFCSNIHWYNHETLHISCKSAFASVGGDGGDQENGTVFFVTRCLRYISTVQSYQALMVSNCLKHFLCLPYFMPTCMVRKLSASIPTDGCQYTNCDVCQFTIWRLPLHQLIYASIPSHVCQ